MEIEKKCDDYVGDKTEFLRQRVTYKLPDGQVLELNEEMFKCVELMYNPLLMGDKGCNGEIEGLDGAAYEVSSKVDIDIKKNFFENIIVTGGNSKWKGLKERMIWSINKHNQHRDLQWVDCGKSYCSSREKIFCMDWRQYFSKFEYF